MPYDLYMCINRLEEVYYDLIEFIEGELAGRHLPVPIAIRELSRAINPENPVKALNTVAKMICKIPLAEKIRDDKFFYCDICEELSFFRCKLHNDLSETTEEIHRTKEKVEYFIKHMLKGNYGKFRYVKAIDWW